MIDKSTLQDSLIAAVESIKGTRTKQVVRGLRKSLTAGSEPDIPAIAKTLRVDLEDLLVEFSAQILLRTGELIVPTPRMH